LKFNTELGRRRRNLPWNYHLWQKLIASAFSASSAVNIFVLITTEDAESAEEEGDKEKRTAQVFFSTD
jgi:hypothetical protein